jgi:hypothetical protein
MGHFRETKSTDFALGFVTLGLTCQAAKSKYLTIGPF